MKKTDKTALTAAIFAAAMGAAAVSGGQAEAADVNAGLNAVESQLSAFAPVYGPSPDFEYTQPVTETTVATAPVTTVPDPVYGPPWMMTTVAETTAVEDLENLQDVYGPPVSMELPTLPEETVSSATTAAEPDPTSEPASIEPTTVAVYGPMWAWGDANTDGNVDVFDLPLIRKYVVSEDSEYRTTGRLASDVNNDGYVNVADLVAVSQYLMGQRDSLGIPTSKIKENKIRVIYDEDIEPVTEEPTSPFDDIPQPKYGPVYAGDMEEPTESIDDLWGHSTVYGPPSFFGLEDF